MQPLIYLGYLFSSEKMIFVSKCFINLIINKQMFKFSNLLWASMAILCLACSSPESTTTETKVFYTPEEIKAESEKAMAFYDRVFDEAVDRSPFFQTYLGIKKDYGKWSDISDENAKNELAITKKEYQWLKDSIQYDALDDMAKVSYDLWVLNAEEEINDFEFRHHDYPVNQMFGAHSNTPSFMINMHQITDKSDAEAYISRLNGWEAYFDQLILNLKLREEKGIVPPKFVFPRVIEDSKNVVSGAPFGKGDDSALFADFKGKVNALELPEVEKEVLIKDAEAALVGSVKNAYDKLGAFLEDQETRATEEDGVWKFPNGAKFYNAALKSTTTTDMTAEQIHELGLKEVTRIHGEMKKIMTQVGFKGELQEFFEFMRTDKQFYYPNTEEGKQQYLDSAVNIIDNMRDRLDELFLTKPKAPIKVKRVEAFREKSAGTAFYQRPAPDGSRPGLYYANLYDMQNMPKYQMEALAYHEGIPGHHMQLAIQQEFEALPKFRKFGGYTAYTEGWGLYCELIPKEMGLYANPYSDFGRLAMELWRACRLVVDTGIHYKKWTRDESIEYYKSNTPDSERDCIRMVERHIVMASQATAYKIGMLKLLELRAKSKTALGDKFDIREFHDVVLLNGAVPLFTLEKMVDEYIAAKKG